MAILKDRTRLTDLLFFCFRVVSVPEHAKRSEKPMKKVNFLATDGMKLNGIIYESEDKKTIDQAKKVILSVHGMTSNCLKQREEIIAKEVNKARIDYFCFNNRGSEIVKYIEKTIDGKKEKKLAGTAYIVYTYHELKEENDSILKNIKGIILLSLVDIPKALKIHLKEDFTKYLKLAEEKEKEGKSLELMPKQAFIHPVSVKTFLRYARDNQEIDFANFGKDLALKRLNNIDIPLFMRWGNVKEMILQQAEELVSIVTKALNNPNKDINYIEGANHSYQEKEQELAEQIVEFIKND